MDIVNILIGDLDSISFMVGILFSAPFWFYWGADYYKRKAENAK